MTTSTDTATPGGTDDRGRRASAPFALPTADVTSQPTHRTARARERAGEIARGIGGIRIPDFVLFFLLVAIPSIPGTDFKPQAFVLAAAAGLSAVRRPQYRMGNRSWWMIAAALALCYVAVVSIEIPPEAQAASWQGRLMRLTAVMIFVFCIASGRLDLKSGLLGYATGMALNIPLFYAGLVSDTYGGFLTGWFGDKNVAGLVYSLFGLMFLWFTRSKTSAVILFAIAAVPLWLTGSRTSLAAYAAGALWMVVVPKLPLVARWIVAWLLYIGVGILATRFATIGAFAERTGSDELRSRIDAASEIKVHATGFFGRGLGSAFVDLGDAGHWFFHNSYWSALVEGGWPWTVFIVGITVMIMIRPFSTEASRGQFIAQGVGVAVLICASQLGEVFGTEQWAVAMGFALRMLIQGNPVATDSPSALTDPPAAPNG